MLSGKTNFGLYDRYLGYRPGLLKKKLSKEQQREIEETVPCPHDPVVLSQLFLKGKSKLKMEESVARKSAHLLVLNNN